MQIAMPDVKHFLPLLVYLSALLVLGGAFAGAGQRILKRNFPALTEAAYFVAACAFLLWAMR